MKDEKEILDYEGYLSIDDSESPNLYVVVARYLNKLGGGAAMIHIPYGQKVRVKIEFVKDDE